MNWKAIWRGVKTIAKILTTLRDAGVIPAESKTGQKPPNKGS